MWCDYARDEEPRVPRLGNSLYRKNLLVVFPAHRQTESAKLCPQRRAPFDTILAKNYRIWICEPEFQRFGGLKNDGRTRKIDDDGLPFCRSRRTSQVRIPSQHAGGLRTSIWRTVHTQPNSSLPEVNCFVIACLGVHLFENIPPAEPEPGPSRPL